MRVRRKRGNEGEGGQVELDKSATSDTCSIQERLRQGTEGGGDSTRQSLCARVCTSSPRFRFSSLVSMRATSWLVSRDSVPHVCVKSKFLSGVSLTCPSRLSHVSCSASLKHVKRVSRVPTTWSLTSVSRVITRLSRGPRVSATFLCQLSLSRTHITCFSVTCPHHVFLCHVSHITWSLDSFPFQTGSGGRPGDGSGTQVPQCAGDGSNRA